MFLLNDLTIAIYPWKQKEAYPRTWMMLSFYMLRHLWMFVKSMKIQNISILLLFGMHLFQSNHQDPKPPPWPDPWHSTVDSTERLFDHKHRVVHRCGYAKLLTTQCYVPYYDAEHFSLSFTNSSPAVTSHTVVSFPLQHCHANIKSTVLFDTGASCSFTNVRSDFVEFTPINSTTHGFTGTGKATGKGIVSWPHYGV